MEDLGGERDQAGQAPPEIVLEEPQPRSRRWRRAVGLTVVVGLVGAGLAATALRPGPKDAEAVLAEIVAFVDDAGRVHIEGEQEQTTSDGRGGLGSTFSDRSRVRGDLSLPSSVHLVVEHGAGFFESIAVGDLLFTREALEEDDLAAEQWDQMTMDETSLGADDVASILETEGAEGLIGQGMVMNSLLGKGDYGFPALQSTLEVLTDPERVTDGVIKASMPLRDLMTETMPELDGEALEALDDVDGTIEVELTSGPGGRLDRMRTVVEMKLPGGMMTSTDDLRFSRWGEAPDVVAPPAGDIDPTPSFDEEAIAQADFTPLAPRAVPDPLRLLSATFYQGDPELDECDDVSLSYGDPDAERRARDWTEGDEDVFVHTLDLTSTPASCYEELGEDESWYAGEGEPQPISIGGHEGTIVRFDDPDYGPSLTVEVRIGDVHLSVHSDIDEAQALRAIAELVPLDLSSQPVLELDPPERP